jgi:hypothetical protein
MNHSLNSARRSRKVRSAKIALVVMAMLLAAEQLARAETAADSVAVHTARARLAEFAAAQAAPQAIEDEASAARRSLPFLRANRIFLLSRLAANAGPGTPDPRLKRWLDEQLLAAVHTLGEASKDLPQGTLGDASEFDELVKLAALLDSLRTRMTAIEGRLAGIRTDFALHQSTELLVALAGPVGRAPAPIDSVRLRWNGYEVGGWKFDADEREALKSGSYRPLHRAFARPEAQAIEIEVRLANGQLLCGRAEVAPAQNRLTVVVLEVLPGAVGSRVWTL